MASKVTGMFYRRHWWIHCICREIEINEKRDSREMAKQIREISGEKGDCKKHCDQGQTWLHIDGEGRGLGENT